VVGGRAITDQIKLSPLIPHIVKLSIGIAFARVFPVRLSVCLSSFPLRHPTFPHFEQNSAFRAEGAQGQTAGDSEVAVSRGTWTIAKQNTIQSARLSGPTLEMASKGMPPCRLANRP